MVARERASRLNPACALRVALTHSTWANLLAPLPAIPTDHLPVVVVATAGIDKVNKVRRFRSEAGALVTHPVF